MSETAVLRVLSLESATTDGEVICVVRCIEGNAALGMGLANRSPGWLTLTRIGWYGKEVEQLDTAHHGRVTLAGPGAGVIRPQDTLVVAEPNGSSGMQVFAGYVLPSGSRPGTTGGEVWKAEASANSPKWAMVRALASHALDASKKCGELIFYGRLARSRSAG
ncbi:hypothetical protein [Streptomyces wuyuanensis]|uniref:hypothetical protein n=1 Tax=Streptomyces wuyuanensis TaxID=1196353 RepID=UPI0037B33EDD